MCLCVPVHGAVHSVERGEVCAACGCAALCAVPVSAVRSHACVCVVHGMVWCGCVVPRSCDRPVECVIVSCVCAVVRLSAALDMHNVRLFFLALSVTESCAQKILCQNAPDDTCSLQVLVVKVVFKICGGTCKQ